MAEESAAFISIVSAAIAATPIARLLAKKGAVVLERLAHGGGATNWYYCASIESLKHVEAKLRPGSDVRFYFDDRIRRTDETSSIVAPIMEIIEREREAVLGILGEDGIRIDVDFPGGLSDIRDALSQARPDSVVFYGSFPRQDNDGISAVSLIIPDLDGVVRKHPH